MAAGCAGPSPSRIAGAPPPRAALLIDGLSPPRILTPREIKRITRTTPADLRGDVIAAEALGSVVYAHNRLAALAGGLVAPGGRARFGEAPVGWITERKDGRLEVDFLVKAGGTLRIAAEVSRPSRGGKPEVHQFRHPRALKSEEKRLWRARELAFSAKIKFCSPRYNPVVIPLEAGGKKYFYVYLLPAGADPDSLFFGGYYRITVDADAARVLETHAFTRNCIKLRRNPKATAVAITEVNSSTPTTAQVYANLAYGLPLRIATTANGVLWLVRDGQVFYQGVPAGG